MKRIKLFSIICLIILLFFVVYTGSIKINTEFTKFSAKSCDGGIDVSWQLSKIRGVKQVVISIFEDDNLVEETTVNPSETGYTFTNGRHGKLYCIEAKIENSCGEIVSESSDNAMFLEFENLPSLPLVEISTTTGIDPTYEEAEKPDKTLCGRTIVNNDYMTGRMHINVASETIKYDDIKIKIRGNTSALNDKKPYKIHFDKEVNPLNNENGYKQCDWLLLNVGNSLNTYVGNYISEICGMEWTMHAEFVNVVLNGDWKGCYYLVPAVCYEASNGLIDGDGYLFENDAYWWTPDTVYFKLDNQIYQMGYTFKYPEITNPNDERLLKLQQYMQELENLVLSGDERYERYINIESFVNYLLVKDIIGEGDGAGSNYYFYKNNNSRIKIGPIWDFDGAFKTKETWSTTHTTRCYWFPVLYSSEIFYDEYVEKWMEISPQILKNVSEMLEELENSYGEAIRESWNLDNERWGLNNNFDVEKKNIIEWFIFRVPRISNMLKREVTDVSEYDYINNSILSCIDSENVYGNNITIEGWAYCLNENCATQIGILAGNNVYLADMVYRSDVQEYYSLDTEIVGFSVVLKGINDYKVCIIDAEAKKIYL